MKRIYLLFLLLIAFIALSGSFETEASFHPRNYNFDSESYFKKKVFEESRQVKPLETQNEVTPDNQQKHFSHTIKRGETLSQICRKYNMSIENILSLNSRIDNINLIIAGEELVISKLEMQSKKVSSKKNAAKVAKLSHPSKLSQAEKMAVIEDVAERTGLPWQVLAGLTHQESGFGKANVGDGGRSIGPFQINLPSHPEVTKAQAMDFKWSANWAGNHLLKLKADEDLMLALRLWNGSSKNPKTLTHAKLVMHWAKNTYGYKP